MADVTIGVISDTHGLLRPEAVEALRGSDIILHAGDVGKPYILQELKRIAPLHVVRGNVDYGELAALPFTEVVEIAGKTIYMLHIFEHLDIDPASAGFDAVIYGHTHEPHKEWKKGVLYLNPGSAGPHRFSLPVTLAKIHIVGEEMAAEILKLV